jgi:hypothetical protein
VSYFSKERNFLFFSHFSHFSLSSRLCYRFEVNEMKKDSNWVKESKLDVTKFLVNFVGFFQLLINNEKLLNLQIDMNLIGKLARHIQV